MSRQKQKLSGKTEFRPGDNFAFLLDRTDITDQDLVDTGDDEVVRMAREWLRGYPARFFFTIARNFQPVAGSKLNTFDSHDDSVLFPDKAALLEALPKLAAMTAGAVWVIFATRDVEDAVRSVISGPKPH